MLGAFAGFSSGLSVNSYFKIEIFGTVLGLFMAGAGAAITLGSAILSLTLYMTDSFALFMSISGVLVLLGSLGFLRVKPMG